MNQKTINEHIEINDKIADGRPHVKGHRIKVKDIVIWHEVMGKSADEISAEFNITLADVYSALTYYYDNRKEIDDDIQESKNFVNSLKKNIPSRIK